jgi:hypothetical protein
MVRVLQIPLSESKRMTNQLNQDQLRARVNLLEANLAHCQTVMADGVEAFRRMRNQRGRLLRAIRNHRETLQIHTSPDGRLYKVMEQVVAELDN